MTHAMPEPTPNPHVELNNARNLPRYTPDEQYRRDTLGKTCDKLRGGIRFNIGSIQGMPGKSLRKDGSVINTDPPILPKKKRRINKACQRSSALGYNFLCGGCGYVTFHYESTTKIRVEGYENKQEAETYECCICHTHFDKNRIDAMVEKAMAEKKQNEGKESPK